MEPMTVADHIAAAEERLVAALLDTDTGRVAADLAGRHLEAARLLWDIAKGDGQDHDRALQMAGLASRFRT